MLPFLTGHNLTTSVASKTSDCEAYIQGKLTKRPSTWQLPLELLSPLHRDVSGPINPPSGHFCYFFVLVDASGHHSVVSLLTTKNMVFPKFLTMLIRFKTNFPDFPVKFLRMDNAQEFRSHAFKDYCIAADITITYSIPYEHSHNGLAEAFIKKIQLITRPLLIHTKLPPTMRAHVVLHAISLIQLRPTLLNAQTSLELTSGRPPNISHLRH